MHDFKVNFSTVTEKMRVRRAMALAFTLSLFLTPEHLLHLQKNQKMKKKNG